MGAPTADACIALRISRRTIGQIDPAFKGGSSVEVSRVLRLKIVVVP